ncbi:P-loop containing nucleoside triphosphate hydrolase protein [Xylariaceae sp. FL1272]|nr:P-loop containing nucleoside triphosphate hydrolase protein [Xylariaceae sp. FL1272]
MSRHQAYRNYDYENDLDEYAGEGFDDEEDELSPEDRAQMAAGTSQVRTQLGDQSSKISTQQIEEALWHYYYDVEKSVAYLITKYVAATPAKPQKTSIAGSMAHKHTSFSDFFHDMPWLHIPDDRRAVFIEPVRPPGGLLGGSKLQALAAARKKKAEEQKIENQNPAPITTQTAPETAKAAEKRVGPLSQRLNAVRLEDSGSRAADQTPLDPMELDGAPTDPVPPTGDTDRVLEEEEYVPPAPSAFAQTLFGSSSDKPTPQPPRRFQMPWMMYTSPEALTNAFSEPSPDDKVLAAQAKASNKKLAAGSTKKKVGSESKDNGPAAALKGLKIDDTPLPKSKNLDVISEFERAKSKKSASFVVVGHVDAGKSTLMGRLLLDLGVVDQRTIQKYRKEAESIGKSSFALAWVLDQRSEERSRGVTIDIATNKFETDSTSFTILDAPGHRDFIPNMIAGASQADFAILVVDASTGAFEAGLKGQTKEHSLLLRSMGVSRIIVAVNKLDTVSWSEERFEEISNQVSGFLSATGFQLKNVTFVPVSGLNGDNLVNKSQDVDASWYTGNTLIAELENSEPMTRALTKPLRMTISEVFRTSNSPITVSGRIDAGSLQAGDALLVQPSGEKAYVKSLELDQEPRDWAVAGQNIVIHLANIDPIHVRVGDIICDTKQPITCIDEFTVKVLAFDVLMPMQVDVHRGRLHAAGQIKEISALLDKVKGTVLKKKPKIVKPASVARVVVNMGAKVPLEVGQRVVLRCGGETVAAGLLE